MSNVKISNLTATTELADDDLLAVVDESDTAQAASGSTRKTLLSTLRSWLGKDEDDMASDSATHFPTQQSVKAYVDDETSQLMPKTGGTFTGAVTAPGATLTSATALIAKYGSTGGNTEVRIDSIANEPRLTLYLNGVFKYLIRANATEDFSIASLANGLDFVYYDVSEDELRLSNVTSVTVPAPTADDHAATKAYVDDETSQLLPLTGGTLTGNTLQLQPGTGTSTIISKSGDSSAYVQMFGVNDRFEMRDEVGNLIAVAYADSSTGFTIYPADYSTPSFRIAKDTGAVSMTGAPSVTVPTPTADSHAATKKYVDDETAQLAPLDAPTLGHPVRVARDTNGVDEKLYEFFMLSNGKLRLRPVADDGTATSGVGVDFGRDGSVEFLQDVTVPDLKISGNVPDLWLYDEDGTADSRSFKFTNNGATLSARVFNDDGTVKAIAYTVALADGSTEFVQAVTVPAPTADDHAATKAYVDDETSQSLMLSATAMRNAFGSTATLGDANNLHNYFTCPASQSNLPSGIVQIPDSWSTVDVFVLWANQTTTSGSVNFRCDYGALIAGALPVTANDGTTVGTLVTTANQVVKTQIGSDIAVTGGEAYAFGALVSGGDAAISLYGLVISKAS